MRKIALIAAAALFVAAAPVAAQEAEIVPTAPCEASEDYATLGIDGAVEEVTPSPVPSFSHDFDDLVEQVTGQDVPNRDYPAQSAVTYLYRLDLSGSEAVPAATTAGVALNLNWDNDGDYDLYVYDTEGNLIGEGQNGFNPLDGAGEAMSLSNAAHCLDFRVDIVNYLGASPVTEMTLTAKVSKLK